MPDRRSEVVNYTRHFGINSSPQVGRQILGGLATGLRVRLSLGDRRTSALHLVDLGPETDTALKDGHKPNGDNLCRSIGQEGSKAVGADTHQSMRK